MNKYQRNKLELFARLRQISKLNLKFINGKVDIFSIGHDPRCFRQVSNVPLTPIVLISAT